VITKKLSGDQPRVSGVSKAIEETIATRRWGTGLACHGAKRHLDYRVACQSNEWPTIHSRMRKGERSGSFIAATGK